MNVEIIPYCQQKNNLRLALLEILIDWQTFGLGLSSALDLHILSIEGCCDET